MKRIIILILALVLALSLYVTVFASNVEEVDAVQPGASIVESHGLCAIIQKIGDTNGLDLI